MAKTVHLICDYCGEAIEDGDEHVRIDACGRDEASDSFGRRVNENLGHFHATLERPCYEQMWDRMSLVHETASLENIPTATAQEDHPAAFEASETGGVMGVRWHAYVW